MARINLLPVRALARLDGAKHELLLAGLFNLGLLVAVALGYQLQQRHLDALREARAQADRELAQMADQVQRTKVLDDKGAALSIKLAAIDRLRAKKAGPAQFLGFLSDVLGQLPRVWLNALVQEGERLTLEGGAMSQGDISAFQLALGAHRPAFRDVTLALVSTAHNDGARYLQWTISCRAQAPVPAPEGTK